MSENVEGQPVSETLESVIAAAAHTDERLDAEPAQPSNTNRSAPSRGSTPTCCSSRASAAPSCRLGDAAGAALGAGSMVDMNRAPEDLVELLIGNSA